MWKAVLITVGLTAMPVAAIGQPIYIELGAAAVRACLMNEASCNSADAVAGLHAGVWNGDRFAVRFRFLEIPWRDSTNNFGGYAVQRVDSARQLWLGELTWHFGQHPIVRPYAGVAVGARRDHVRIACAPFPCEDIPRSLVSVQTSNRWTGYPSVGGVGGVMVIVAKRLAVGAQLSIYDFMGEHAGTNTLLLQIGYRHPITK